MGLILGCRLLVYSSLELASLFNVSGMIIGLVILALVTTVPELIVTVTSAVKGLHQLVFGTILGSNVFNILIGGRCTCSFYQHTCRRNGYNF